MNSRNIMKNPVLPSPWTSRAPSGFSNAPKRPRLSNVKPLPPQSSSVRTHRHPGIVQQNQMLKKLNRDTLILTFPHIKPDQIETALSLCHNDLSKTIAFIRLRHRVVEEKKVRTDQRIPNRFVSIAPKKCEPSRSVKYIPTKYSDVQIVEVSNNNINKNDLKIVEVNHEVLKMLQTCTTVIFPGLNPKNAIMESTGNSVSGRSQNSVSSGPEFSPATVSSHIGSSACSETSEKLKVYDFEEDEPVLHHLPKPSRKPPKKVGIVLRKTKFGLSVSLL